MLDVLVFQGLTDECGIGSGSQESGEAGLLSHLPYSVEEVVSAPHQLGGTGGEDVFACDWNV